MHIMTFVKNISTKYLVFDKLYNMAKIVFLFNNVDSFVCRSAVWTEEKNNCYNLHLKLTLLH